MLSKGTGKFLALGLKRQHHRSCIHDTTVGLVPMEWANCRAVLGPKVVIVDPNLPPSRDIGKIRSRLHEAPRLASRPWPLPRKLGSKVSSVGTNPLPSSETQFHPRSDNRSARTAPLNRSLKCSPGLPEQNFTLHQTGLGAKGGPVR